MIANNFEDFNSKIKSAMQQVHYILGHKAGNQFFKKFLLKRSSGQNQYRIPVSLPDK
jgi:hypothetical protein